MVTHMFTIIIIDRLKSDPTNLLIASFIYLFIFKFLSRRQFRIFVSPPFEILNKLIHSLPTDMHLLQFTVHTVYLLFFFLEGQSVLILLCYQQQGPQPFLILIQSATITWIDVISLYSLQSLHHTFYNFLFVCLRSTFYNLFCCVIGPQLFFIPIQSATVTWVDVISRQSPLLLLCYTFYYQKMLSFFFIS